MAFILEVLIVDPGDHTIKVGHSFYGVTEEECRTYLREHTESCEYFRSAVKEDRVIEFLEEIEDSDLPQAEDFEEEED